ncbi:flavin reductase family protein [Stappia sp.]|uniref:flavin reductase family protein n=1 Tax=Stappia sp. TaxID=1870903 RepID=UPI003A9A3935
MMHDLTYLRRAFGTFATGVTVITTRSGDGTPRGFTANSFSSVSLEPALLSVCVAKSACSADVFHSAPGFGVNILSADQRELSQLFASKDPGKFRESAWQDGPAGNPILDGVAAWFDCTTDKRIDAGDHFMLLGRIEGFDRRDCGLLGYAMGGYIDIGSSRHAAGGAS